MSPQTEVRSVDITEQVSFSTVRAAGRTARLTMSSNQTTAIR